MSVLARGLLLLCLAARLAAAAGKETTVEDEIKAATVEKELVILRSTASYKDASDAAARAAKALVIPLNLRDLQPHGPSGLTFPARVCQENGWDFPCYVARGRFDDGQYLSIERSDAYTGFKKGLYIVILASGPRGNPAVRQALTRARTVVPDAYARVAPIYVGCMH